ncbi:MAG: DNA-processing protein DprA [Bacteroidales bacterium]|nr:DNA-processing protein DprA [Bacteroidales bacterium]
MVPGIGCRVYRQLLEVCGDPKEIFRMGHRELRELFGRHEETIGAIESGATLKRAEEELRFAERYGVDILFCRDEEYPQRLNRADCADTPVILYRKGKCDLNGRYSVGIVGTRKATVYGKETAERIVKDLKREGLTVVSGLAYGIDTASHRASVANGVATVGVLGHGLDMIYPSQNRSLAAEIVEKGGALVSEYMSGTKINPANFPARNRIIAALSDAVIVVEASEKGGALITANIANSYHRDVFAVPGRLEDTYSRGCLGLVAGNRATLYSSAKEFCYAMRWEEPAGGGEQQELFATLNEEEREMARLLEEEGMMTIDEIYAKTTLPLPKIAKILMEMEFKSAVKCLPGKRYKIM